MKRQAIKELYNWKTRLSRKPLIIRGARQVGKSYLVRQFAHEAFEHFIEINFDLDPEKAELFEQPDINQVLDFISLDSDTPIIPGKTLIFLDEIQKTPALIAKLRYFYEQRNDIHIIAAGSLLDFVLSDHEFSMPVGRIEYLFMGPMNFKEFLLANTQEKFISFIESWSVGDKIPASIHQKILNWHLKYTGVGGMPAAVAEYSRTGSLSGIERIQRLILQTYSDDFSKYKKRINVDLLKLTLDRIPHLIGNKLKYVDITPHERAKSISESIQMLQMARVIYRVHHSSGNKVPLTFEKKARDFKMLFLDTGLLLCALDIKVTDLLQENSLSAGRGEITEQLIGQELLYQGKPYEDIKLYYWNREKRNAAAEVDYLISFGQNIIPIEVKAGTTGSLKSLKVFAAEKKAPLGVRFNTDTPSLVKATCKELKESHHQFNLLSLPLYLASELERLVQDVS